MADADMAQVAEHILGKDEVTSSNLVISSIIPRKPCVCGVFVVADFLKTRSKLYDSDECREHYMIGISMWCEGPLYLFFHGKGTRS